MPDAAFVAGDSAPALEVTLESGGTAENLADASGVQFHMRKRGETTLTVDAAAAIVDTSTGLVSYSWASADLSETGTYDAEFEVSWSDGTTQTYPAADPLTIDVREQLD